MRSGVVTYPYNPRTLEVETEAAGIQSRFSLHLKFKVILGARDPV